MNKEYSVYPSKIDWWLAALLVAAPLSAIALGIYICIAFGWLGLIAVFTGLFIAFIMALLIIPCRYTITDTAVEIKCGMIEERINFSSIIKVTRTFDSTSAPALSLHRVKITSNKGIQLISPIRRDDFIVELKQKCKNAV